MREITAFADDCSVFRNGRHVESFSKGSRSGDEIVEADDRPRLQRCLSRQVGRMRRARTPVLEVKSLTWGTRLAGIDLTVGKGEIVGLGGLDGQGQRELLLSLFGVLRGVDAEIKDRREPRSINSPRDAKRRSVAMALIPEDRKTEGLVLPLTVRENISPRQHWSVCPRRLHPAARGEARRRRRVPDAFDPCQQRRVPVGTFRAATSKRS